ncbi:MAG: TMEM175 family protein [Caldilineaceae bacterium]
MPITPSSITTKLAQRLVFFSDAVMAIAITLLALEIRLPSLPEGVDNAQLWTALSSIGASYLSYGISFGVIGLYWLAHHRTFRDVVRYDGLLMLLNLLLLCFIAFIPFPTAVLGEYGNRTATIFYAGTMAAVGIALAAIWWYSRVGGRLVTTPLSPHAFRSGLIRVLLPPLIFMLSIGLALWNEDAAQLSWALTLLSLLFR